MEEWCDREKGSCLDGKMSPMQTTKGAGKIDRIGEEMTEGMGMKATRAEAKRTTVMERASKVGVPLAKNES